MIFVYQMAKVASMAWMEAARPAAQLDAAEPVHAHFLTDRNLLAIESVLAPSPHNNSSRPYMARQILRAGRQGRAAVAKARRDGRQIRVITGMRDPVARSISLMFFFADFCGHADLVLSARDDANPDDVCAVLVDLWQAVLTQRVPEGSFERLLWLMMGGYRTWFTEELAATFELDVFAKPFPAGGGAQQLQGRGVDLLLYRAEDLPSDAPAHLTAIQTASAFLRTPSLGLPEVNTAATRRSYPLYRQTRDRFRLPADMVEQVYAHPAVRHFYADGEIAAFKARWTA